MREEVTAANLAGWFRGGSVVMLRPKFLLSILIHQLHLIYCGMLLTQSRLHRKRRRS